MKKVLLLLTVVAMLVAGCSDKPKKRDADSAKRKAKVVKDQTTFARIESIDGDSINLTTVGNGQQLRLPVSASIIGDIAEGDTVAMMRDGKNATKPINVSQLKGLWMYAENSGNGIRISGDGGAANIGEGKMTLRTWRMSNGQLMFTYIIPDGTDYTERQMPVDVKKLGKDSLVYTLDGQTYSCLRSNGLITVSK